MSASEPGAMQPYNQQEIEQAFPYSFLRRKEESEKNVYSNLVKINECIIRTNTFVFFGLNIFRNCFIDQGN